MARITGVARLLARYNHRLLQRQSPTQHGVRYKAIREHQPRWNPAAAQNQVFRTILLIFAIGFQPVVKMQHKRVVGRSIPL